MELEKSKEKQKRVKCALCHKSLHEGSRTSHACFVHGTLELFECGYCQKKFRYNETNVKKHIGALHMNSDGTVDLNNFKDLRRLNRKEIRELRDECFPVVKKRKREESDDYWDEYSDEPDASDGSFDGSYESEESSDESRPELQCDLCNTTLSYPYSMTNYDCSYVKNFKDNRKKPKKKSISVAASYLDLQCVLCNFILTRPTSITNHSCSHANFVIYECEHCPRKFNGHDDRKSVKNHIRNHHKKNGQLVSEADYKDNRKALAILLNNLVVQSVGLPSVPQGAKQGLLKTLSSFRKPMASKIDRISKQTFKCALCSKILTNPKCMRTHAINVHSDLVLFECGYENCHQKFYKDNVNDVRDHIEEKNHTDQYGNVNVENFKDNRKKLKWDIEKLKERCFPPVSNNESLQCVLCNFVLTRARSMTNHACSHANLVIYECGHCPRKFNSHDDRASVRKHIRNHHKMNGQLVSEDDYKDNRKALANEIQLWKIKCFPNHN